jgi:hypothetical protein
MRCFITPPNTNVEVSFEGSFDAWLRATSGMDYVTLEEGWVVVARDQPPVQGFWYSYERNSRVIAFSICVWDRWHVVLEVPVRVCWREGRIVVVFLRPSARIHLG